MYYCKNETDKILKKLDLFLQKKWGQNFLIDKKIAQVFIDCCNLQKKENIIEIGPGLGALTEKLKTNSETLILIEIDKKIAAWLQEKFINEKNIMILNNDVLKVDYEKILKSQEKYKVIGNLPYSSATKILSFFLKKEKYFQEFYFTFPEEIAEKILAKPGNKKYGFLTILTNLFSFTEKKILINKEAFYPTPKITSVLIKFKIKEKETNFNYFLFLDFIKKCFKQKRKTLLNNLKNSYLIEQKEEITIKQLLKKKFFTDQIRAESLTIENFKKLFHTEIIKLILKK